MKLVFPGEMLSKMAVQEASVTFFLNDMIDEVELQSILEKTSKKNPSFPYWKYDRIGGTILYILHTFATMSTWTSKRDFCLP